MSNTKSPDSADSGHGSLDNGNAAAQVSGAALNDADGSSISQTNRLRLVGLVASVIIVLDQITKVWAASSLADRDIDLFWTARFHVIRNYGSAFGLGSQFGRWLGLVVVLVVIGVVVYSRSVDDRKMLLLLGGVVGGAIGNLIDRLLRAKDGFMSGGVVDFIDFQWWPVFNVADIAVVLSAIGLMILSLQEPE